jgi:hypothetical protein
MEAETVLFTEHSIDHILSFITEFKLNTNSSLATGFYL